MILLDAIFLGKIDGLLILVRDSLLRPIEQKPDARAACAQGSDYEGVCRASRGMTRSTDVEIRYLGT